MWRENLMMLDRPVLTQYRMGAVGARLGDLASDVTAIKNALIGILQNYCNKQGASANQCAAWGETLNGYAAQLQASILAGDVIGIGAVLLELNNLKTEVQAALAALDNVLPPPTCQYGGTYPNCNPPPPPPSTGLPWVAVAGIAVGTVAVVGGILYAVFK